MSKTALQLHKKNFGDELNLYEDWEQDKSEVLNEFERSYSCTKVSFNAPLHKQIITLQKFNIHISIDISIKTHQFVCIRLA